MSRRHTNPLARMLAAAVATALAACSTQTAVTSPVVPAPTGNQTQGTPAARDTAHAAFATPVTLHGVRVTLLKVQHDSRCPMNALCVWAGDAIVVVRLEQNGQSTDVTLHTNASVGASSTTYASTQFTLVGLTPFLVAGQNPPAESSYTALIVAR